MPKGWRSMPHNSPSHFAVTGERAISAISSITALVIVPAKSREAPFLIRSFSVANSVLFRPGPLAIDRLDEEVRHYEHFPTS